VPLSQVLRTDCLDDDEGPVQSHCSVIQSASSGSEIEVKSSW
jgi:hypothetical protein